MNAQALEKVPPAEPTTAVAAVTPMSLLQSAVASGNLELAEKLMTLQDRWEASQARKQFDAAVSEAKAEIPAITRNATGHNSKRYADFAAIAKVVDPILGKHGLSYRFRTTQNGSIAVTCILSHKAGHSEETTLIGPADSSGNKNAIQAIGSTLTYLQRYSLVQMLGLAASADDDGKAGAAGEAISEKQAADLRDLMEVVTADRPRFLKFFKIETIEELPAKRYQEAVTMLNAKQRG